MNTCTTHIFKYNKKYNHYFFFMFPGASRDTFLMKPGLMDAYMYQVSGLFFISHRTKMYGKKNLSNNMQLIYYHLLTSNTITFKPSLSNPIFMKCHEIFLGMNSAL